jgi:hypothetical protein
MAKYGVVFDAFATTTTAKSAIGLNADAGTEKGEVVELLMTGSGTAAGADRQHRARVAKCTFATAGTGTSFTPEPFTEFANAAKLAATVEYSAEPTVVGTAYPILWGFNQRSGMRWGVPQGEGLSLDGGATEHGLVFQVLSDAAGEVDGHLHFWEP